ncbi:putative glycosyl hydrolase [Desulfitobacterium dichloroeliminans LMG P-21439]|uniref:Putative glycosyl hydrolase n=1 Tax=Desulfitobacterium dichloroeliminans (strain LMG P-21439 / DCA1) TaxID=871963 RepID=L0F7Q3_DESDL|nr:LysM domain-containing protein [Desulfitobacterium dichloroeliminans]AGA69869.1 putative glycosyl hydrolase [Desulfitobacterium dichloroeliminans LMG P-21439]
MEEYVIQQGDTFYRLAQRWGGTCAEWQVANPGLNPDYLQIGQKVYLPRMTNPRGNEQYAMITPQQGMEYAGDHLDDIEMEIEGVKFRVKRIGESKIPHEIHLLVPRTEIRKVQPHGINGPCEVQIMLSNVNIIHSPRLMSDPPRSMSANDGGMNQGSQVSNRPGNAAPELSQISELRSDTRPDSSGL